MLKNRFQSIIYFLLFCSAPLFFIGGPHYHSPRSFQEVWNLGHVLFFSFFTLVLYCSFLLRSQTVWFKVICCFVVAGALGGAIEFIQLSISGRSCSLADVGRDLAGVALVTGWLVARESCALVKIVYYFAGCFLAIVLFVPFTESVIDELQARRDFPVLAEFARPFEVQRWEEKASMQLVSTVAGVPCSAAKIELTRGTYSGVSLLHFSRDWSGWKALQFRVYNPDAPVVLHFRVHDALHQMNQKYQDRYNGARTLVTGWNTIKIPLDDIKNAPALRKIDITNVYGFSLFVMNPKSKRLLYLDYVRLL